jgi:predicted Zn finger-like uncharacterized protein
MKIVCDACQAKYSISDDKVQGKVFKIRCKKCSNIIVVRGSAGAAEPAPSPQQEKETHVYDYGYQGGEQPPAADDAVWHVVINQDQVGPMSVADVQARFQAGEIDAETYCWREGFADWMPLNQVDTFASVVHANAAAVPASQGGGGNAAVAAMFGSGGDEGGTSRNDPGDLFAAASSRRHEEDDVGGDLFGNAPAQQQQAANQKLRGERNENSVLFSLNNLAQLASDKPAPAAASSSSSSSSSPSSGHATGAAGGEGSGLIDIRSMASAYLGNAGAAAKPAASVGSIDDLPVFGGGGFHEPAVIVPTSRPANNNKIMYVMIAAVGVFAIAAIVMVVILMKGGNKDSKDDKNPQVADNVGGGGGGDTTKPDKQPDKITTPPTTNNAGSGSGTTDTTKPDTTKPDTTKPDTTKPDTTQPDTTKPDTTKPDTTKPKQPQKTTPPKKDTKTTPPGLDPNVVNKVGDKKDPKKDTKTTPTTSKPDDSECTDVACVIDPSKPCCAKYAKKGGGDTGPKKPVNSDLPATLDRDMISAGIGPVKGKAQACGEKFPGVHGKVKVHVKVGPGGNVTGASVSESPDPGLGSCVSGAVSRASFAKTQQGGSFSYPFPF